MGIKILLIDDDEEDQMLIAKTLNEEGIQDICFALTATDGLQKVNDEKPDLVLVDTVLPDLDGFEVCKRIKSTCALSVRVIMLTGVVDAVDATKARENGCDEYCVKTTGLDELRMVIKQVLQA